MNVYDSSRISAMLTGSGHQAVDTVRDADLIIVNTCTIRGKARQKAVSFLGRLASQKRKNPDLLIAVGGCVAQAEGRALIDQFPHVDVVFGTHAVSHLPELLRQAEEGRKGVVDTTMTTVIEDDTGGPVRSGLDAPRVADFVTIMRGCDNYCTYCVVPYVRGREISRKPDRVVAEIRELAAVGVKEIVLLGQNVNSYGNKEGLCSFPELLAMANAVDGIERIRFTTSHPKDLSDALIHAFESLDKLCPHFHLPVQSGSSRVLKRMNRKYTRAHYLERVSALRQTIGDIAITTDIIVGFPGETEEDFEETVSLLEEVEFDSLFGFMYSDRTPAPAAKFADKISEKEKNRRLNRLLDIQKTISARKNEALAGQTVSVLVEGPSRRAAVGKDAAAGEKEQWTGRTTTNKVVNFTLPDGCRPGKTVKPGDLIRVGIENGFAHSLIGRMVKKNNDSEKTRERFHAA